MQNFEDALTPEEWCRKLARTGATISSRTLRIKARELGQFYSLGRAMMLNSAHIEALLSAEADHAKQGDRASL
ncbi:MAG: hypothetical protein ABJO27_08180 [Pseudoruegeria sp.]